MTEQRGTRVARGESARSSDETGNEAESAPGKGRPTPSRKEAQAARAQPLVGRRDKAATKVQRQKQAEARERARVGMMRGDERYLGPRDKGPQRRYVRDYVDARFSVGEFLIPLMLIVLLLTLVPDAQVFGIIVIWAYLGLSVIDVIVMGILLQRRLAAKFGRSNVQPGFRWYAAMRALQFRMLRVPKPQVKRLRYPS